MSSIPSSRLLGGPPRPVRALHPFIKFDALLARARAVGAETVATGHIRPHRRRPAGPELHRGVDEAKTRATSSSSSPASSSPPRASRSSGGARAKCADRPRRGLGGRRRARHGDLFRRREVEAFVAAQAAARPERFAAAAVGPATVVDEDGAVLGEGSPYYRYTVGQRRRLGVAAGHRLYVLRVLPEENRVVVGDEDALAARGLIGERCRGSASRRRRGGVTVRIRCAISGSAPRGTARRRGAATRGEAS